MGSLQHNSECFRAINLKLGTDTCLGLGKMPIHFGVTVCKKVKIAPMGLSCPTLRCYILCSLHDIDLSLHGGAKMNVDESCVYLSCLQQLPAFTHFT